jgi:hypothetical protein
MRAPSITSWALSLVEQFVVEFEVVCDEPAEPAVDRGGPEIEGEHVVVDAADVDGAAAHGDDPSGSSVGPCSIAATV